MGHEFRTPVNSILALCRLLLGRSDGELTAEQERQVTFIQQGAQGLSELVNDLLDLAKVEAGKTAVRPDEFEVIHLFGALRGMFRPMVPPEVTLVLDEPGAIPPLYTDEGKVSQILRNFISNALKFTQRGHVRVSAALDAARQEVVFAVADTGIGIVPEDQDRIFEEFAQAEHHIQQRTKGTGLGLPLARKLAELLGGSVNVQSTPGRGSVFSAIIPLVYGGQTPVPAESQRLPTQAAVTATSEEPLHKVMIVDDDETARYVLKRLLTETPYTVIETASGSEGLRRAREDQPQVIFLDLRMPEMSGFEALERLKSDTTTRDIPVVIITSKLVEHEERRLLDGKVVTILSKAAASREALIGSIRQALSYARPTQNEMGGVPQHG